jgi:hypothetical protein
VLDADNSQDSSLQAPQNDDNLEKSETSSLLGSE